MDKMHGYRTTMTYEEAQSYIASLAPRGWRLGLDRMQAFVDKLGLQDSLGAPGGPQFIHITGTNGKGSVTEYVQSVFTAEGYRTGGFFSPFVYDPRERVQLNRRYISKEGLAKLTEKLMPIAESFSETEYGGITEFEFKTALAFQFYKEQKCDWVALEVGLGGRLDATNVVTPRASVIVSIGLDHTSVLGHTVEEIAYEKAGIIKQGVPVIVGQMSNEALAVIEKVAEEQCAPIWRFGKEVKWHPSGEVVTPIRTHERIKPGIIGYMQDHNVSLAVAALDATRITISDKAFTAGSQYAQAPGRFEFQEINGLRFLLDGAHNPDAARVLIHSIGDHLRGSNRIVLITGMVAGHEPHEFYKELAPLLSAAHVVPIDFHRALPPETVAASLHQLGVPTTAHSTLKAGIDAAMEDAGNTDVILVTGSFYLVGEVGRTLKFAESS